MNPTATLSHYKQYPNQPYPENLPPPMTSVPQIIATGNPAYTQQQQQQIYMQQQQIYQHQQTLRRQMQMQNQMTQNQSQYVQSQPQYVQSQQQPQYIQNQQSHVHPQQQQIHHQQPPLPQQQQQPQTMPQPVMTQSTKIHVSQIPPSVSMAMNNPNNPIYVQTKTFAADTEIPSSNIVDSDMFERDKQIYKCSTLRHGGKYDLHKPSVIPAVIPTVPKIPNKFSNAQEQTQQQLQQQQATSITNRPLPEIPKVEEIPKELPYNR